MIFKKDNMWLGCGDDEYLPTRVMENKNPP